jgi:hypothetical protein
MRATVTGAGLALLLLAGCGEDGDGDGDGNRVVMVAANPHSDQLKGLSEFNRNLGLRRAIVDSGNRCKKVDVSAYQEQYKTMAMWTARCTDSGTFAIYIAPNADVQVRRCKEASQLGLPECNVADVVKDPNAPAPTQ